MTSRALTGTDLEGPHNRGSEQKDGGDVLVLRRGREALRLLLEAYQYAADLQRSVWDFAVEIQALRKAGWTRSELRWLVCKGYVQHSPETTEPDAASRTFHHTSGSAGLSFCRCTCCVLTETGFSFAQAALDDRLASKVESTMEDQGASPRKGGAAPRPNWDRDRQELRVGDVVVKQFKVPAANQERILAAFEEDGWPTRIDDPLPPLPDQDPKRRLHDTVNSLNRNQKRPLLRFIGDGTGQGVRWELCGPHIRGKPDNGQPPA